MNLQQRLAKLEEKNSQAQPVVIWVNSNESKEEACKRSAVIGAKEIIFVSWSSSEVA